MHKTVPAHIHTVARGMAEGRHNIPGGAGPMTGTGSPDRVVHSHFVKDTPVQSSGQKTGKGTLLCAIGLGVADCWSA